MIYDLFKLTHPSYFVVNRKYQKMGRALFWTGEEPLFVNNILPIGCFYELSKWCKANKYEIQMNVDYSFLVDQSITQQGVIDFAKQFEVVVNLS